MSAWSAEDSRRGQDKHRAVDATACSWLGDFTATLGCSLSLTTKGEIVKLFLFFNV